MNYSSDGNDSRTPDCDPAKSEYGLSRRNFIKSSMAGAAAGAIGGNMLDNLARAAGEDGPNVPDGTGRTLIHGGVVLSLDPAVGDFEEADVLIEGKKIVAVAPNLKKQNPDAFKIDARGTIVLPGFITTHEHQWQTLQRGVLADGTIQPNEPFPGESYGSVPGLWNSGRIPNPAVPGTFLFDLGRPPYDPEDNYLSQLVCNLSQIAQGITCGTDLSGTSHFPEHTDATIQGLVDSGRRTLYGYSGGTNRSGMPAPNPAYEYPGRMGDETLGMGRLRKEWFNSDDQLVTLGTNQGPGPAFPGAPYSGWELGRSFGAWINNHSRGPAARAMILANQHQLGPDVTLVHCCVWQDEPGALYHADLKSEIFEVMYDKGVHVSCVPLIDQQMGQGMPAFQLSLNYGILPSLSPDAVSNMTPDPFSLMRGAFCIQRCTANEFEWDLVDPNNLPKPRLVTCRQIIEMATIAGAAGSGLLHKVGTLSPGKEADIVMLDTDNINIAPLNNAPGAIVTLMDTSHVRNVMIAGKIVFWKRQLVGWDVGKLVRDVKEARERVLARLNGPYLIGPMPSPWNNSFSNPYRPNFLGSCCDIGKDPGSPQYVLRP